MDDTILFIRHVCINKFHFFSHSNIPRVPRATGDVDSGASNGHVHRAHENHGRNSKWLWGETMSSNRIEQRCALIARTWRSPRVSCMVPSFLLNLTLHPYMHLNNGNVLLDPNGILHLHKQSNPSLAWGMNSQDNGDGRASWKNTFINLVIENVSECMLFFECVHMEVCRCIVWLGSANIGLVYANAELQYNARLVTVEPSNYAEDCGEGIWEIVKDFDPIMEEGVFLDNEVNGQVIAVSQWGRHHKNALFSCHLVED